MTATSSTCFTRLATALTTVIKVKLSELSVSHRGLFTVQSLPGCNWLVFNNESKAIL